MNRRAGTRKPSAAAHRSPRMLCGWGCGTELTTSQMRVHFNGMPGTAKTLKAVSQPPLPKECETLRRHRPAQRVDALKRELLSKTPARILKKGTFQRVGRSGLLIYICYKCYIAQSRGISRSPILLQTNPRDHGAKSCLQCGINRFLRSALCPET